MQDKTNLLGYSQKSLEVFFKDIDEPAFRAKQLLKWVHQKGELDFRMMTDFNKSLRERLKNIAILKTPTVKSVLTSEEGTKKYLVELESGSSVEKVRIPEKKRMTLCISSQAGCALQCTFCATGAQGFDQNLTSDEIIGQVWLANFYDRQEAPITNVVFMGMGEPLLNFDPVLESVEIMRNQIAYCLSRKRITISTSGIVPQINKLADLNSLSNAPLLSLSQANKLLGELETNIYNADWITIGIMAPSDNKAIEALQSISNKYSSIKFGNLDSLHADGSVFLKGNQKTGNVYIRSENGLGEGILITCQYDEDAEESNTFGPLPLDFFS